MKQTLTIPYAVPSRDELDLLLIEQEEWDGNIGVVTTAEMLRYVSSYIYNQLYSSSTPCALVDGQLQCYINAYPRQEGLVYRLLSSWGNVSGPRGGKTDITEILNFTLTSEERVKYPCHNIKRVSWLDVCYNAEGAVVPNPQLTVEGDSVIVDSTVYGSVEVLYTTEKYTHILTVPRREDAIEGFFSAAVYALYHGGISWIEVDMPDNFDETSLDDNCGIDGSVSVVWPEDDPRPVSDNPYRRRTVVNYCTQETISDVIS